MLTIARDREVVAISSSMACVSPGNTCAFLSSTSLLASLPAKREKEKKGAIVPDHSGPVSFGVWRLGDCTLSRNVRCECAGFVVDAWTAYSYPTTQGGCPVR